MATKNTTGTTGAEAAALPAAEAQRLRNSVKDMDAMSQEGFGNIEALARVTLLALKTPDAHRSTELIARVLEAIRGIAQTSLDAVNSTAEAVGCNWFEADELHRAEARRVAVAEFRETGQG